MTFDSERVKKLWKDPEYRRKTIEGMRQIGPNPKKSEAKRRHWQDPKYREKMSEAHKKRWQDPEFRRKVLEGKRKKWAEKEFKKRMMKISKKAHNTPKYIIALKKRQKRLWQNPKYRKKHSGENHYMWQGGISFEPYPPQFNDYLKEIIKKRDNYTCQKCGSTQKLTVHHIDYNKKNNNPINLITLCNSCNVKANYDKPFWKAFLTQKMLAIAPNKIEKHSLTLDHYLNNSDVKCQEAISTD